MMRKLFIATITAIGTVVAFCWWAFYMLGKQEEIPADTSTSIHPV